MKSFVQDQNRFCCCVTLKTYLNSNAHPQKQLTNTAMRKHINEHDFRIRNNTFKTKEVKKRHTAVCIRNGGQTA